MAALPSPTQVAGPHCAIYEAYYNQVDPSGSGIIQASDAARFLKKSRLSDVVLSKVWDLSDPSGKGYLDKGGLFVALKLVALAQSGKDINMTNINSETPPPKVGEMPKVPPTVAAAPPSSDWSVKPAERDKYNQLFDSLQPLNGLIPGNKVKGVLMESKLPMDTLGKIWDLADQDKDGMLDRHEFIVAMHLVYKALEKHAIPTSLPIELRRGASGTSPHPPPPRPPSRPASRPPSRPPSPQPPARPPQPLPHHTLVDVVQPALVQPLTTLSGLSQQTNGAWVVNSSEKAQYDALFTTADVDRDGFVSGTEIKDTFLRSGLPQPCLAHIWSLCDWDSTGKLSSDQFALAMWMVARRLRGIDPPPSLTPEMVPPSARSIWQAQGAHIQSIAAPLPPPVQPVIESELARLGPNATPELEAAAREIDELAREKLTLEAEISLKDKEFNVQTGEADSLQSELDTLAATFKQLEIQRGEAQKRLNDLQTQVDKLRSQASTQEMAVSSIEGEVTSRKAATAELKEKEKALKDELKAVEKQADMLNNELQRSVLAISQANIKLTHLEDHCRSLSEAEAALDAALASVSLPPPAHHLSLVPLFSDRHLHEVVRGATPDNHLEDDQFNSPSDSFGNMNGTVPGFESDPFKEDPFSKPVITANDPFAPTSNKTAPADGFASDPFAGNFSNKAADPFGGDAFSSANESKTKSEDPSLDPFGCDPFAVLHAPPRGSSPLPPSANSSPAPSLPPKKHKTPPPRPAPPRPAAPNTAHTGFGADFANFGNKFTNNVTKAEVRAGNTSVEDFTEDPFKDYRYEDPFNIEDPFADPKTKSQTYDSSHSFQTKDINKNNLSGSFTAFEADDFFSSTTNRSRDAFDGRSSVPLPADDPFPKTTGRLSVPPPVDPTWATWSGTDKSTDKWSTNSSWTASDDSWATNDNWTKAADKKNGNFNTWNPVKSNKTSSTLNDAWGTKNNNIGALSLKKEKSPKSASKLLKISLGRNKSKNASSANNNPSAPMGFPSEEQQIAWAATESKRLEEQRRERWEQEESQLQLALALSRSEK